MKQYKVAVVTGTRAEYGLLSRVIFRIETEANLELQLIVTGSHLSEAHGETVKEIEKNGVAIYAKIPILKYESTPYGTAQTTGYAIQEFAKYFNENRVDVVLVLGDRFEIFAVVTAAAVLGIPIAHISGGDVTLGAQDEFFRHAITKMAKLHFPSNEESATRLCRMGEEPFRTFNVGGLGDENIRRAEFYTKEQLEVGLQFALNTPFALITFHPETIEGTNPKMQMQELLSAMNAFPEMTLLFTKANADAGGEEINRMLDEYCENRENAIAVPSLGLKRYLSAMSLCDLVIGNSSSGVVEAPTFKKPVVDIGNRQSGRHRSENVIHCEAVKDEIVTAVNIALSEEFAEAAKKAISIYDGGDTSGKIVEILKKWLDENTFAKPKLFYDGGLLE